MRGSRGHVRRRHDRRLGPAAVGSARTHIEPHHQRGFWHQPRGLRRLVEAAVDDRMGMIRAALAAFALTIVACGGAAPPPAKMVSFRLKGTPKNATVTVDDI